MKEGISLVFSFVVILGILFISFEMVFLFLARIDILVFWGVDVHLSRNLNRIQQIYTVLQHEKELSTIPHRPNSPIPNPDSSKIPTATLQKSPLPKISSPFSKILHSFRVRPIRS